MMYRLRQLARALTGRISTSEQQFVADILSANEAKLFWHMPRFDQRHCLDVAQTLQHAGHSDLALLRAALLHDSGKVGDDGKAIPLLYYGMFVVLKKLAPALYHRAAAHGRGVLRPFAVHANHEQRAVMLATKAGSSVEVVNILQAYAACQHTAATRLLAWADNQN